jgi:hypothetical protein
MGPAEIQQFCRLDESGERLLKAAVQQLQLSARADHRVLKRARNIADLSGERPHPDCPRRRSPAVATQGVEIRDQELLSDDYGWAVSADGSVQCAPDSRAPQLNAPVEHMLFDTTRQVNVLRAATTGRTPPVQHGNAIIATRSTGSKQRTMAERRLDCLVFISYMGTHSPHRQCNINVTHHV